MLALAAVCLSPALLVAATTDQTGPATTQAPPSAKKTTAPAAAAAAQPAAKSPQGKPVATKAKPAKPVNAKTAAAKPATGKAALAKAPAKPKPPAHDPKATRILDVAGLGEVTVYAPTGEAKGLALFASGDGGWNLGVWDMAHEAASLGYWVAGFSTPGYLKTLENTDGACSDADSLLDRIGDRVKTELKLPAKWRPVLIGYSSGATIAYAALAESGDTRYGGAMTLGFCPDLIIHRNWCEGAGKLTSTKMAKAPYTPIFNTVPKVDAPWIVLQGEIDQVCNPPATKTFVEQVKGGHVVMLPKVGHGYSVPRNWMTQYRQGLQDLLDALAPAPKASGK